MEEIKQYLYNDSEPCEREENRAITVIRQRKHDMELWDIYAMKQTADRTYDETGMTGMAKPGEFHPICSANRKTGWDLSSLNVSWPAWAPGWWEVSGGTRHRRQEGSWEAVRREVREETRLDSEKQG